MLIKDVNGRVGQVTEIRETGVFARPQNVPYIVNDSKGLTFVAGAKLITATFWTKQPDGSYQGLWFDSPLGAFTVAHDEKKMFIHSCLRCGYDWAGKTEKPIRCSRCKSPYWNKPLKSA